MSNIPYTALGLALLMAVPAMADETKASNPTPRQMAHCMMARVKVTPTETYKTAFKACRAQFESVPAETGTQTAMNNTDPASPKH